jgi:hypothetical protein
MRAVRFTLPVALALALCVAPLATAHPRGAVVEPAEHVAGMTGGELLGESWAYLLSRPASEIQDGCVALDRRGMLLWPLGSPITCTGARGTSMFIWIGSECSSAEPEPSHGDTAREQRACAIRADQAIDSVRVTVDDGDTVEIRRRAFEVVSPQRTVELPPGNIFGVDPRTATFVAHAWAAHVTGLRPGRHTLTIEVPAFPATSTINLDILRGR